MIHVALLIGLSTVLSVPSAWAAAPAPPPAAAAPAKPDPTAGHAEGKVLPADESVKRKALKEFAMKKGLVPVKRGSMVCSDGVAGRGYVVVGDPGKDQRQPVDVYDRKDHDHKPKRLKAGVPVYIAKSDGGVRGLEFIYEDPENGVVSYKVFECNLKLSREQKP
jgi:hypothetical protein